MSSRSTRGSVLPIVAFGLSLFVAFCAFAVDVTRSYMAAKQLQFAADSVAVYGLSQMANADGTYSKQQAQENILNAVASAGQSQPAWNSAPKGPDISRGPVELSAQDVQFVDNSSDPSEVVLRLVAKRDGSDSLTQFFMPAVFAPNVSAGGNVPEDAQKVSILRAAEVIGQPATRIGPGRPSIGTAFASFPLALSNLQFSAASQTAVIGSQYKIDVASSVIKPLVAGHIRAGFVNVARGSSFNSYYGPNSGTVGIDNLEHLVEFFTPAAGASSIAPACVEQGVTVGVFDANSTEFQARKAALLNQLKTIPLGKYFVFPVSASDPTPGLQGTRIIGFARMRLIRTVDASGTDFDLTLELAESIVLRNCVSDPSHQTIPSFKNAPMPPSTTPFLPRRPSAGTVSKRMSGLVLAPVLSPTSPNLI